MSSALNQHLDCHHCTGTVLASDAFDIAFKSWPQQMWIAYRCPTCNVINHLAIGPDRVAQGYLDGVPGPCHIATRVLSIPKLSVKAKLDGISIGTMNLSWEIPASP